MSVYRAGGKRLLDFLVALTGLLLTGWLIAVCWLAARCSTGASGFFRQQRVGRAGRLIQVVKLRTMRPSASTATTVTARDDPRITRVGGWLRRRRLDELPQLWNVLRGDMSLVGPRPDVPGFADRLQGEARAILALRPGITGPATLAFREEEELLARQPDPERYNSEVIWPAKVALNLRYAAEHDLGSDLGFVLATFLPALRRRLAPAFQPPAPPLP